MILLPALRLSCRKVKSMILKVVGTWTVPFEIVKGTKKVGVKFFYECTKIWKQKDRPVENDV